PVYRKAWAMVETGRLLGEDVSQWETLLNKEVPRLEKNRQAFEIEKKRLQDDPHYQVILAAQDEIDNALTARLTAISP
ncbi:MAG: hypothetical protein ACKO5Q_27960, partial [Microcystaceae cyanobacterium]